MSAESARNECFEDFLGKVLSFYWRTYIFISIGFYVRRRGVADFCANIFYNWISFICILKKA